MSRVRRVRKYNLTFGAFTQKKGSMQSCCGLVHRAIEDDKVDPPPGAVAASYLTPSFPIALQSTRTLKDARVAVWPPAVHIFSPAISFWS